MKMKKNKAGVLRGFLILLIIIMLTAFLTSCGSKFSAVRRSFEDYGFEYTFVASEYELAQTIRRELDESGCEYEIHYFTYTPSASADSAEKACVAVIEFADENQVESVFTSSASNTLKYLIDDYKSSDYVFGNCVLVVLTAGSVSDIAGIFSEKK